MNQEIHSKGPYRDTTEEDKIALNHHDQLMGNGPGGGPDPTRFDLDKNKGGCFTFHTPVMTPYGWKAIGEIQKGELVQAIGTRGKLSFRPVLAVKTRAPKTIWQVSSELKTFEATGAHSVLTENGWQRIDRLKTDDFLKFLINNETITVPVLNVSKTEKIQPVFNLIVSGDYTFVVDGCLAHSFTAFRYTRMVMSELKAWVGERLQSQTRASRFKTGWSGF